jgi:hypothetical protein
VTAHEAAARGLFESNNAVPDVDAVGQLVVKLP